MSRNGNWTWCWACPMAAALLTALCWTSPAAAQAEIELGTVVDADARTDEMLFLIQLDGPGILTVVARPPAGQESGQDLTLALYDSNGDLIHSVDSDTNGLLWNEQFVLSVGEGGEYVIEVGSIGSPGPVRVGASFISIPDLVQTGGKELELNVGISDVVVGSNTYTVKIPEGENGFLTVFTRGQSGDIALEILNRAGGIIASSDSDLDGSLVNEAIMVRVQGGQDVTVRVRALQDNTAYSMYAHFVPDSALPQPGEMAHILIGTELPDVGLVSLDGDEVNIHNIEPRVAVIDFWASWCGPCRRTLPELVELAEFVQTEELPVAVYAVNVGEDRLAVEDFLASERLALPVLLDSNDALSSALRIDAIPTTLIVVDGKVTQVRIGASPNYFDTILGDIMTALEPPAFDEALLLPASDPVTQ